ncbi:MAG: TonB-dependent receptor, partial [Acidobacteria bacterium]|nr:TonB-dependent receptor [Acidobacteriota bacterium]
MRRNLSCSPIALLGLSAGALFLTWPAVAGTVAGTVAGRIARGGDQPVAGASVTLRDAGGTVSAARERSTRTDAEGRYRLEGIPGGRKDLVISASGFAIETRVLEVAREGDTVADVALVPGGFAEEILVSTTRLAATPEAVERTPGSVEVVDGEALERSHVVDFSEALRKVSGVTVRDEEGFGLRPNIGIRGLNPTRSSKVLLLEDGIPLAFAPYGDNASYYHPPIERYREIEVLKGSGQIVYGPTTVGGVVNYLTPDPPETAVATGAFSLGSREFVDAHASFGTTLSGVGLLVDVMRKQGQGAREATKSTLDDANLKATAALSDRQSLAFRASLYREHSNVTYSGLTEAEFAADPRQNPFVNDDFRGWRAGVSLAHALQLSSSASLSTRLYGSRFSRDWWRQSSNSSQRPNDRSDPACAGMQNLNTTCGNEGKLRDYLAWGLEPRLSLAHDLLGAKQELTAGVRFHAEDQNREQQNGATPVARSGVLVEDNSRKNQAFSAFVQDRILFGALTVTPGIRLERIRYERTNRLAHAGAGVTGSTRVNAFVPGLGLAYQAAEGLTLFAGIHRGFAPPRTEDIIDNTTGGVVELDPELSWNTELGARATLAHGVSLGLTFFRMDYENQVVPASVAGGAGATLTNGGETLHQGLELSARVDVAPLLGTVHDVYLRGAFTWLPTAEFRGTRTSSLPGAGGVSVSGNRLPYAPEALLTAALGYAHPAGPYVQVESVHQSAQFGDDLNSRTPSADGQRGLIPSSTTWNASAGVKLARPGLDLFVTV